MIAFPNQVPDRSAEYREAHTHCYRTLIPDHTYTIALGTGEHEGEHLWQCEVCGKVMGVTTVIYQ